MHVGTRLTLAALIATCCVSLAVGSGSANRLSVSSNRFRITWPSINMNDENDNTVIECAVTLEGSFHSATINKVRGALIGHVSRGIVRGETCVGGSATILQEKLPWHVTYRGFTGTLPNITGVQFDLSRSAIRVSVFGGLVSCLYQENGVVGGRGTVNVEAGGGGATLTPDPSARLPKFEGGGLCPTEAGFTENGSVTVLGSTARITVKLI